MYARSERVDAKIKSGGMKKTRVAKAAAPDKPTASTKPPGTDTIPLPKRVFICSPLRPTTKSCRDEELQANLERAKKACKIAVTLGFLPLAPHLYFTQFLDDENEQQREKGMAYGMEWLEQCDEVWVFGSKVSTGMKAEIKRAEELGKTVRMLPEPGRLVEMILKEMLGEEKADSAEEGANTTTEQPQAAESEEAT